jgi:stage II sporulation protein D
VTRRTFILLALSLRSLTRLKAAVRTDVRVGVFGLFHPRALTVRPATDAGIALQTDRETSMLRRGEEARVTAGGGSVQIAFGDRTIVAPAIRLAGPAGDDAELELSVPGRIARAFRGRVEIATAGDNLVPIVSMDLETAVASVVAAEQTASTPLEALKAQAVAARSYFVAGRGRHRSFDFCDTTHCQFLREPAPPGSPAARAAQDTRGLTLAFRGAAIVALYSASCGGHTRSLADAGLQGDGGYPYFSVDCSYCERHASTWESRLALDAESAHLEAEPTENARLAVGRRHGWSAVPGNNFETTREADAIILRGRGQGHGVGLCQAGAAALASEGGATFAEILAHYYPGTALRSAAS